MSVVRSNTPWEIHNVDGVPIHVKREDLCCPEPGPAVAKARGVELFLRRLVEAGGDRRIGVMDASHSRNGWCVAYVGMEFGIECFDFFPVLKCEHLDNHGAAGSGVLTYQMRDSQQHALRFGAEPRPMDAGRTKVMYYQARKQLAQLTRGKGCMLPNALKLPESVEAVGLEVVEHTPIKLQRGTWIISVASGTLAAGVVKGLAELESLNDVMLVFHQGYSQRVNPLDYIRTAAGVVDIPHSMLIDEGFEYKDAISYPCPFPCSPYYDLKSWCWLGRNIKALPRPIIFWNLGA